jgi:hypothetical protein
MKTKLSTYLKYLAAALFLLALVANVKFTLDDELTFSSEQLLAQEECSDECDTCPEGQHCQDGVCVDNEPDPSEDDDEANDDAINLCDDGTKCECVACIVGETDCKPTCPCCE